MESTKGSSSSSTSWMSKFRNVFNRKDSKSEQVTTAPVRVSDTHIRLNNEEPVVAVAGASSSKDTSTIISTKDNNTYDIF